MNLWRNSLVCLMFSLPSFLTFFLPFFFLSLFPFPFFCFALAICQLESCLFALASAHDPPNLCLPSSKKYRCMTQHRAILFLWHSGTKASSVQKQGWSYGMAELRNVPSFFMLDKISAKRFVHSFWWNDSYFSFISFILICFLCFSLTLFIFAVFSNYFQSL
jgi:hypothetical protein